MSAQEPDRPAFYARGGSLSSDLLTLLHPPYTAWHLSYVVLGAVAAPRVHGDRVSAALLAFFLAVGVGAHAFDELHDRPLRTRLSNRALAVIGSLSLLGATGIGVAGIVSVSVTLAPFVLFGAAICLAYNLELFHGRFHNDAWFALAWGAFPALTGYWVNALSFTLAGGLVATACAGFTVLQRRLSTPARLLRRKTASVGGEQRLEDGSVIGLSRSLLLAPLEGALQAMSVAIVLLAAGLLAVRLR
jgi:uncharacterized membrane protein YbaN (DUF454 family)